WTSVESQLSPVVPAMLPAGLFSTTAGQYLVQARMGGKHHLKTLLWLFGLEGIALRPEDPRAGASKNLVPIQRLAVSCVSTLPWRWPFASGLGLAVFIVLVV